MGALTKFYSFTNDTPTSLAMSGWSGTAPSIVSGGGPYGENAAYILNPNVNAVATISVPTGSAYLSFGANLKCDAIPNQSGATALMTFALASGQFIFVRGDTTPSGSLYIGYSSNISSGSSYLVQAGQWFHLQVDLYSAGAGSGYAKMRINGAEDVNITGVNTGSSTFTGVRFGPSQDVTVANMWIAQGGYRGEAIARSFLVTGDGTTSPNYFTPSTGSTHYGVVDEAVLDEADYISSDATNFVGAASVTDTFTTDAMVDIPEQFLAFQITPIAKKVGTSPVVLRGVTKYSGTDHASSGSTALATSSSESKFIWEDHPDGSTGAISAMDPEDARDMFNACEFGVKLSSS